MDSLIMGDYSYVYFSVNNIILLIKNIFLNAQYWEKSHLLKHILKKYIKNIIY